MTSELHIVCATQDRQPSRLDNPWPPGELPSAAEVIEAAQQSEQADRWLLCGGEPTLRSDLPSLIQALAEAGPELGMRTDGLLLDRPGIDQQLHDAGLRYVRIALQSGRADAHDWLVGLPGASARVTKALASCARGPLDLEAEVTLTRPTAPLLLETISYLVRHGVGAIHLRLLERRGPAADDYIALAPRLALLQPLLEDAVRQALRHGVQVRLSGLPLCVAPSFPECHLPDEAIRWALPPGLATPEPSRAQIGCPGCPGPPRCSGAPAHYTDLFGWTEIQSEGGLQARAHPIQGRPTPTSGEEIPLPPARAGRAPATRLRAAIRQAEVRNLGGDPMAGRHPNLRQDEIISIELSPESPTRALRMRMVRAAQHGAPTLRIQGASLQHPEAHSLLREAQRLSFERVELWGDGRPLDDWSDVQIRHLRGLHRLVLVHGDEDKDIVDRLVERIGRLAGIVVDTTRDPVPTHPSLAWTDETGGTNRRDSG
jgi:hypothetical protein